MRNNKSKHALNFFFFFLRGVQSHNLQICVIVSGDHFLSPIIITNFLNPYFVMWSISAHDYKSSFFAQNMLSWLFFCFCNTLLVCDLILVHDMDKTTIGPEFFWKKYYYICVLILAILFYKIIFYFPLRISLILLKVMLYSQTFL